MAGPDPRDPNTLGRPPVNVAALAGAPSLAGLRIGVFRPYFDDAEPDVVRVCRAALDALVAAGATLVEVSIAQLGLLRAAHLVTIISEMAASHARYIGEPTTRYGYDVRLNLALARRLAATDYVQAQRLRAGFARDFEALYRRIDVLATPTTGRTAPVIPADALATGESNLVVTDQILRFALPANVLGYPAISVPAGYDGQGLPVGLQLMGRPWEDAALFAPARVVEAASPRKQPRVHRSLLK
jgi:Asp-tRNA(Asn)/Glu-tRNA(Gln) amidotransferase A subunit family amidase